MKLEIHIDERAVLLRELEECCETLSKTYREQTGREWDPYDPRNHDLTILVRARDQLRSEGARRLEGPRRDLELLVTRLRAGAAYYLKLGCEPMPLALPSPNSTDPGGTDQHLDLMRACDRLLARLLASE